MSSAEFDDWHRLDKRTLGVTALTLAGIAVSAGVPTAIGLANGKSLGVALAWVMPSAILLVGAGVLADLVRWRSVRYRVTPDRVEHVFRLVFHSRKSLPRERIRSVDLTANPLHRLLGVAVLTLGTGQHEAGDEHRLKLDPLPKAEAERLRTELLHRLPVAVDADGQAVAEESLAKLDWKWIRYAPMSFMAPTLGLAAFGGLLKVADWFGMQQGAIQWALTLFGDLPLVFSILLLAAVALVVGVVGALGLFVEMWWNYRLDREPGGTLRVRRGLFTTRSITVEERRLRGVDVVEPIGNRLSGAARVDAVATGMRKSEEDGKTDYHTLLPATPLALANRVAAEVLGEPISPTEAVRLRTHPLKARGRRVRWLLGSVVLLLAVFAVLGVLLTGVLLIIGAVLAVLLLPAAVLLALDAYRNLGHGITGRYLVSRHGAMRRSTVALERDGVIGWTVTQSIFQRRAGLLTVTATTAAGAGAYSVYDVGEDEGLTFADDAVPELLAPFLERTGNASTRVSWPD